jgi:anti-sigma regulatory factor (Ser/Thr protein kinase)
VEALNVAVRIKVHDSSQIAEARRTAAGIAVSQGFQETNAGKIAIVVTEAATNLLKYGAGGEILLRSFGEGGVELLALDSGPGMANIAESLLDGHSTSGSAGTGLGAMSRLSDVFEIYSVPGKGTAVLCRFWTKNHKPARTAFEVEGFSVAVQGETECGDDWTVTHSRDGSAVFIVDGLGHGHDAAQAADQALKAYTEFSQYPPLEVMQAIQPRLRATRGAAAALAVIDAPNSLVRFCGIGNISGAVIEGDQSRHMVSMNGTLGHEGHRFREFTYPWSPDSLVVLHTDGLSARWDLSTYVGLQQRHPSLIAGVLYRDMSRARDDATCVVVRYKKEAA